MGVENPKGVVFSVRAAVNLCFSCVNPDKKNLKTGDKSK